MRSVEGFGSKFTWTCCEEKAKSVILMHDMASRARQSVSAMPAAALALALGRHGPGGE